MHIDKAFVDAVNQLAAPTFKEITGEDNKTHVFAFTGNSMQELVPKAPEKPSTIEVHTIEAISDLVNNRFDDKLFAFERATLHVVSPVEVKLISDDTDAWGRRATLVKATPYVPDPFPYGKYLGQSEFIIALQSRFVQTDDLPYVLSITSKIVTKDDARFEDNGLCQTVTLTADVGLELTQLKPIVELAPYRSFPEVQQPVSKFLFRVQRTNSGPTMALFEADGGLWRNAAVEEIARELRTKLTEQSAATVNIVA